MERGHRAETGATRHGRNIVSRFRSTRARATLAGMVLLLLLAAVAALATRSTRQEQNTSHSIQERAVVVASLANARGHFYVGTTLLIISVFSEDPSSFMASYAPTASMVSSDLQQAREALVSLNEATSLAQLDKTGAQISQLQQTVDTFIASAGNLPRDSRLSLTLQYVPQMWPGVQAMTEAESGVKVAVMASIGLAIFPQDAHTLVDLVEMSDSAMYAEKRRRPVDRAA